jgi:hypothetical protein
MGSQYVQNLFANACVLNSATRPSFVDGMCKGVVSPTLAYMRNCRLCFVYVAGFHFSQSMSLERLQEQDKKQDASRNRRTWCPV